MIRCEFLYAKCVWRHLFPYTIPTDRQQHKYFLYRGSKNTPNAMTLSAIFEWCENGDVMTLLFIYHPQTAHPLNQLSAINLLLRTSTIHPQNPTATDWRRHCPCQTRDGNTVHRDWSWWLVLLLLLLFVPPSSVACAARASFNVALAVDATALMAFGIGRYIGLGINTRILLYK